jgi:hypothetical protein
VSTDDRAWAAQTLERMYASVLPVNEPRVDDADLACVPPSMQDGEIDDAGNVRWKLVPLDVDAAFAAIERATAVRWPAPLRAILTTYAQLFGEVHFGERAVFWLPQPPDQPFVALQDLIAGNPQLVRIGLVPFAITAVGPVCFDSTRMHGDDAPVVELEHEVIGDGVDRETLWMSNIAASTRALISGLAK